MTRKYELVYVVSPEASDDQVTDLHNQVEAIVQRIGGSIEKTENWGRRRLAYEIGRHKEGTYVLEVLHGTGELMKEIDRRLKVTDLIIRHLVVRVDEAEAVVDAFKRVAGSNLVEWSPAFSNRTLGETVRILGRYTARWSNQVKPEAPR